MVVEGVSTHKLLIPQLIEQQWYLVGELWGRLVSQRVCLTQHCFIPRVARLHTHYCGKPRVRQDLLKHNFLAIYIFIFPEQTLVCCFKGKLIALKAILITCYCPQSWTWHNGPMNSAVFHSCTSRLLPSVLDMPHIQLLNFHFVLHLYLLWYSLLQANGQIL